MQDEFGAPPPLKITDPNSAYMVWLGTGLSVVHRDVKALSARMDKYEQFQLKEEREDNLIIDLEAVRQKKAKAHKDRMDTIKRYFEIGGICVAIFTALQLFPNLKELLLG